MNKARANALATRLTARGFSPVVEGDENERAGAVYYAYKVRVSCGSCDALVIQGQATHETGCPEAREHECFECGAPVRYQRETCADCQESVQDYA